MTTNSDTSRNAGFSRLSDSHVKASKLADSFPDLINTLAALLDHRATSDGGWPDISYDDIKLLYAFLRNLLDAKFDTDSDGDHVIDITVNDLSRYQRSSFLQLPSVGRFEGMELDAKMQAIEMALSNVQIAGEQANCLIRLAKLRHKSL